MGRYLSHSRPNYDIWSERVAVNIFFYSGRRPICRAPPYANLENMLWYGFNFFVFDFLRLTMAMFTELKSERGKL